MPEQYTNISPRERIDWIDNLRGIGILSVVLGHGLQGGDFAIGKYLYSFHLPLFYFISGLVQKDTVLAGPFSAYTKKLSRSLLAPYCFFGLLTYFLWAAKQCLVLAGESGTIEYFFVPLLGMIYGVHGTEGYLAHNGALWFLPCLFLMHCIFFWIRKLTQGTRSLVGLTLLLSAVGFSLARQLPMRVPWGLDLALVCLPFFVAGYLSRAAILEDSTKKYLTINVLALLLPVHFFLQQANSRVDLNTLSFGNIGLFFCAAFAGCLGLIPIARIIPARIRALIFFGRNSIIVFTLNSALILVISVVFKWLTGSPLGQTQGERILQSIAVLGLAVPAIYIVKISFGWLVPGRLAPSHIRTEVDTHGKDVP